MGLLRRGRGDEGAAAVEFALLFPIFMILALGIIAAGTAFSRQINVTQAAREASRYGATYDISQIDGLGNGTKGSGSFTTRASIWIKAVDNAACQAAGNGNPCPASGTSYDNPIGGYDYRCVALVTRAPDGTIDPSHTLYMQDGGSIVSPAPSGCPRLISQPSFPGTSVVQVVLSRNVQFFVLFINPSLHLDANSNTPYEGGAS